MARLPRSPARSRCSGSGRSPRGCSSPAPTWRPSSLVALSVGGILFDGLSQTQIFFDLFGVPTIPEQTLLLGGWLALVAGLAVAVGRVVGVRALVAGLVPISIGYLIAHYLTFIVFDGQRIVLALSDPLGLGWDLLGVGEFEPATGWLPGAVAWSIQLVAVVGGHVIGAVGRASGGRPRGDRTVRDAVGGRDPVRPAAAGPAGPADGRPDRPDPVVARPGRRDRGARGHSHRGGRARSGWPPALGGA